MKKFVYSELVVALCVSHAGAATAIFAPPEVNRRAGEKATFAVALDATDPQPGVRRVSVAMGSLDGLPMAFQPGEGIQETLDCPAMYPAQVCSEGVFAQSIPVPTPVILGSLTVDTDGLVPGVYEILIDSVRDDAFSFVSFGATKEPVRGQALIHINSEPITTLLEITRFHLGGGPPMTSADGSIEIRAGVSSLGSGVGSGGAIELSGGFWFPISQGDCNTDSGVDLIDFAAFQACLYGPGFESFGEPCGCFNVFSDGFVDLRDFAVIQRTFSGQLKEKE